MWTPEELIDSAFTSSDIQPSGTAGYSSTGYTILGEILADYTGLPVHAAITAVATDAGLTQTALTAPDDNALPAPSSRGYVDPASVVDFEEVGTTVEPGTDITDWSNSYGLGIQEVIPGWIGHEGQVIGWTAVALYEPATGKTFAANSELDRRPHRCSKPVPRNSRPIAPHLQGL